MNPGNPTTRAAALGTAAALAALLVTAPSPARALGALRGAASAADATAPVVAVAALAGWALAGWLLLTLLLVLAARVPGAVGRAGAAAARRVAPTAVRRAVELALGLSLTAGVLGAAPAAAAGGPAAAGAGRDAGPVSLDWGGAHAAPDLDWAQPPEPESSPTHVRAAATPVHGPDAEAPVVVRPGDSLWRLAEQDLARRQGSTPTAAQTAATWPSWWAANRERVGDDPDLLLPGTPLVPPAPDAPPAAPPPPGA